jgi:putative transcriptional regulator
MNHGSDAEEDTGPAAQPRYLGGHFLISDITLMDPNFYRSVVLMITHDDTGAFGLVVNNPSKFTLREVVEETESFSAGDIPVYIGGPVQQEFLFLMHAAFPDVPEEDDKEQPAEGVIFEPATQPMIDYLKGPWGELSEEDRPAVRLYAGYSGWGPGQLEGELKAEAWLVVKATRDIVFHHNPAEGWADAFVRKGPLYRIILQTGFKPSLN